MRERRGDIPEWVRYLLRSLPMDTAEPSDDLLVHLSGYAWPGNIRQLGNAVERLAVMSQGRPFAQPWLEEVLEGLSTDVVAGQGATDRPSPLHFG